MSSRSRNKGVGGRIKAVRLKNSHTQQPFADSLGIAQGYLSELEQGVKEPSDTLLIALSNLYEINMGWLLTGKGEMSSQSIKQSLNLAFMREVIEAVEAALIDEKAQLTPGKKSKLVVLMYETLLGDEASIKGKERDRFLNENAIKFIRLAS